MQKNVDLYQAGQVGDTRIEKTNTGHAIEIDVHGKTIRLEFRDRDLFPFIDQLDKQAESHRVDSN